MGDPVAWIALVVGVVNLAIQVIRWRKGEILKGDPGEPGLPGPPGPMGMEGRCPCED